MGHARTFRLAWERARKAGGTLILRNEDLDRGRCRSEFVEACIEDLRWLGLDWEEGPDVGGSFAPYDQSLRTAHYRAALAQLQEAGAVYPCTCSRRDIQHALSAPHKGDEEPLYPGTCRPESGTRSHSAVLPRPLSVDRGRRREPSWRFRVPDGEEVQFKDGRLGPQSFVAGRDFGDFVVWRHDDFPSYQLAVVVDDATMRITEVVRGADLLVSTARQLLLYRALKLRAPDFFHCPMVTDAAGVRLAKRHDALSLRALRAMGCQPAEILEGPSPGVF